MEIVSNIVSYIWSLLAGSVFDINTYIGIILGVIFAPFFVTLAKFIKRKLVTKWPWTKYLIGNIEAAADVVVATIDPMLDKAEDKMKKSLDK